MDIVVLSGKGGTGKTTVATNLSKVMSYAYVEEPNGYIFLKPDTTEKREVKLLNPEFDPNKCDLNKVKCYEVEKLCKEKNIEVIGKIPFDYLVKDVINQGGRLYISMIL